MYRIREGAQVQLLGSGPILREVLAAAELLQRTGTSPRASGA